MCVVCLSCFLRLYVGARSLSPTAEALCCSARRSGGSSACPAMMSLAGGCEILEEMRTSLKLSWVLHISCASRSPVVLFHLLVICLWATYWQLLMLLLCFVFWQRTASLSQLPVEDLRDPLPPQWRCYMSPQGRRYYVNTTNNGKSQWTATDQDTFCSSEGNTFYITAMTIGVNLKAQLKAFRIVY